MASASPSVAIDGAAFDFGHYMASRAAMVNDALDVAVPAVYPEAVTESMRCVESRERDERDEKGREVRN